MLAVDSRLTLTLDAAPLRLSGARMPGLVRALVGYVCDGPVTAYDPPAGVPWPSRANVDSRLSPSVAPWAAAGALKNLALSDGSAAVILSTPRAARCLCRLSRSNDWLESSKAIAALSYLQPRAAARPPNAANGGGSFNCEGEEPLAPQHDEI